MRCTWIRTGLLLVMLAGLPASVNGQGATQASITGIVRDASGAVLPGATVEASSDVLIEKVRAGDHRRDRPVPDHGPAALALTA